MKALKVAAIIPARMASSRFPGKPLINILGLPMIEHVRRRVEKISAVHEVVVATCDDKIKSVVEKAGGRAIMTSAKHQRGTDRIEEAARHIDADIIINVQGDEPMVAASVIEAVIRPFIESSEVLSTNIIYPILDTAELTSTNVVKAVLSQSGRILYLSRLGVPGGANSDARYFKQSGIIAFRKDFLHKYAKLIPTPLETKESVDMLRVLEHDYWIQGVIYDQETKGVDIPEQVKEVELAIMNSPEQRAIFESILG